MNEIYEEMEKHIESMFKNTAVEYLKQTIKDNPKAPLNDLMIKYIQKREINAKE